MDLTIDAEQEALRDATVAWLNNNLPLHKARQRGENIWRDMEGMGWFDITTETLSLDHATEALIFAELGRFLAPISAISTSVGRRWAASEGRFALALGKRILDGGNSGIALGLFDGKAGLIEYTAAGIQASLDLTTALTVIEKIPDVALLNEPKAVLHYQLLSAAYAVGCADAARDMAVGYAKLREQFGKQIGAFQAIKHICADMTVRCSVARSQLYYAAGALDLDAEDVCFHMSAAKRLADQAALENGRANIQIHGGIGMTDEALAHLPLKRAHLLQFLAPTDRTILLE